MHLHAEWADWQNVLVLPSTAHDEAVRDYFGEEVAFFFRWFALYTSQLLYIGSLGALFLLSNRLGWSRADGDLAKVTFGFITITWETHLLKMTRIDQARQIQLWGVEEIERHEDTLPSYNPNLEGTQRLEVRKNLVTLAVVFYLFMFAFLIVRLDEVFLRERTQGRPELADWQPTVQSIAIKVLSFTWRKISPYLVEYQNHRTQSRWNEAMIQNLALVKFFVQLWPFVYTAFLRQFYELTCRDTLSQAAHEVYSKIGWPVQSVAGYTAGSDAYVPVADLGFLKGYITIKGNQTCISGCYPVKCIKRPEDVLSCSSSCMESLKASLRSLYVIQVLSTVAFILVPVALTGCSIRRERQEAAKRFPHEKYTLLQLQAKCHQTAEYAFASWGGSYVEDFLDVAVGYALLSCFGLLYPAMSFIGLICMMIQYRLLAFRMTCVTCRPKPRKSCGIGIWQDVFEYVSLLALVINLGLTIALLKPFREYGLVERMVTFVVAEKIIMVVRALYNTLRPSIPDDVPLIDDFNLQFKKKLANDRVQKLNRGAQHESDDRACDFSSIDLGLFAPNDRSEESRGSRLSEAGSDAGTSVHEVSPGSL